MKVVFFGTPQFAANVLSHLLANGVDVVAVITKPDRPQGRSAMLVATPVKDVAKAHNLPFYQPEIVSALEFAPVLKQYDADLFVVVAYGEIIKQHLLEMPKVACINLHGSLLPKYRGAAPIQRSLMEGEKETGVTIIHMVKKMDAGDMIAKAALPIGPNTSYGELEESLCLLGSDLLLKTIRDFEEGPPERIAQEESLITFAAKIELEDCQIDWRQPAETIHNMVRGVTPHPGAWCMVSIKDQSKRLRVLATRLSSASAGAPAGKILARTKEGLLIACGQGALNLIQVQLEGKKAMSADEFARGLPADALLFIVK